MDFSVGQKVKVDKCDSCSAIVGKFAKIIGFSDVSGSLKVELNFGRGRPQADRPKYVDPSDISLVKE